MEVVAITGNILLTDLKGSEWVRVQLEGAEMTMAQALRVLQYRKEALRVEVGRIQKHATEILYKPGGKGYKRCQAEFEERIKLLKK
jgi:hypothetical protein